MPDLSIVIPAAGEPENIQRLLPWISATIPDIPSEVIVVVPSHEDPTLEVAKGLGAEALVQDGPGYGGALRTGFGAASGRFVLTMDADLSHEPTFIRDLYRHRDEGDVVIASRYVPFGLADMPATRRLLSGILNLFFRVALDLPVRDLSSGFRLYRRSFLESFQTRGRDFDVLQEILIFAFAGGWRVLEAPFHYRPRGAGSSHARLLRFGISYLKTTFRYWRMRASLRSADHDQRAYRSRIPLQRYWHRRRYRILLRHLQGRRRILDIGPSSSLLVVSLPQSIVLDVGLKRLRHLRWLGRRVVRGETSGLPFREGAFDAIVCSQVLEHLPDTGSLIDDLAPLLGEEGILIVGIHGWDSIVWRITERLYRWVFGSEEDRHYRRLRPEDVRRDLEAAGLTLSGGDRIGGWETLIVAKKAAEADGPPGDRRSFSDG